MGTRRVPEAESPERRPDASQRAAVVRKRTEVEDLVRGIHRIAGLREKVTIESVPVLPVLSVSRGEWLVSALLVTPAGNAKGPGGWHAPWAAVHWHWPSGSADFVDLRQAEGFSMLRSKGALPGLTATRESTAAVYQALDRILQSPPASSPDLASLEEFYSNLLPRELCEYYWALVPSTRGWLRNPAALNSSKDPSGISSVAPSLDESVRASLDRAIELCVQFGFGDIRSELEALNTRQTESGRTLAFVGEFGRGKSHLINRPGAQRAPDWSAAHDAGHLEGNRDRRRLK